MAKKPKKEKKEKKGKGAPEMQDVRRKPVVEVPREKDPLRVFFTILLVLVGIGELLLLGYMGMCMMQSRQNQGQNGAVPSRTESGSPGSAVPGTYSGPWLMQENGVTVWEWDEGRPMGMRNAAEELPGDSGEDEETGETGDEKRLSTHSVPRFWYALAEMEEPEEVTRPLRPGEQEEQTVPLST